MGGDVFLILSMYLRSAARRLQISDLSFAVPFAGSEFSRCGRVRRIPYFFFIRFEANLSEYGSYTLRIRMFGIYSV
jgi:hypothetical protein